MTIFVRQNGRLVALAESTYALEDELQQLVAAHPELIAKELGGDKRWLLVQREASIADAAGAGRWSLDHLFLDADGVLTLVEVKRSSDPRARREVVAQMLDYAANILTSWDVPRLRATVEQAAAAQGDAADAPIERLIEDDTGDVETFWGLVRANLEARRLRLVFVADRISHELRSVVEYLNEEMRNTEVLALEIPRFTGPDIETYSPTVVGRTARAEEVKSAAPESTTRDSLLAAIAERDASHRLVAERIFEWADRHEPPLTHWYGRGRQGSWQPGLVTGSAYIYPFAVYPYGVAIKFRTMISAGYEPFDAIEPRLELHRRLNAIPGVQIADDWIDREPSISFGALADAAALHAFLDAFDWVFALALREGRGRNSPRRSLPPA